MASDYLALLDHLKIDKTALVGWSDGGIIGLDIAMSHPERLTRLFAHAANVTTDGVIPGVENNKTFAAYIERSGKDYAKLSKTPDQYDAFVGDIVKMWSSEPAWTKEQLGKISLPTAIVVGDHDEAIKREHTDYMAAAIPGATRDHPAERQPFRHAAGAGGIYKGSNGFHRRQVRTEPEARWCGRRGSNPHDRGSRDFKSLASTNSATSARVASQSLGGNRQGVSSSSGKARAQ